MSLVVVANHIIQFLLILFSIVNPIVKVAMDNSMNQTSSESPHQRLSIEPWLTQNGLLIVSQDSTPVFTHHIIC
jgi:hypothetical protein